MEKIEKVKERVGAIMSALRELTAECRAVEGRLGTVDHEVDVVGQIVAGMQDLNISLSTMLTRVNDLSLLLQREDGSPGRAWPTPGVPLRAPLW